MSATETDPARSTRSLADRLVWRWFTWYARRYVRRRFTAVRIVRPGIPNIDPRASLVVYLNHPSWWDPLTCLLLACGPLDGRVHRAPIDAGALGRYRFFERLGFFGVERDSMRGARRLLDVAEGTLAQSGGTLWLTAQGRFTDPRDRPIALMPGLAHVARRLANQAGTGVRGLILPLAIEYPFWDEPRPEVLLRFGEVIEAAEHRGTNVAGWHALLEARLTDVCDRLREDAVSRDAQRFEAVLRGRAGVSAVYDLYRRVAAWRRGHRFQPGHTECS